ncbi:hypothetical protein B0H67DRAFT_559076 [Lasiosphaeris hirsuta]|uniref:Uncharacterized protein n=1 Tax=Lasiosphaeris hirsuta TaxID=260670 RepID=A0AA40B8C7_9PEZI|nr:hypothetical protein B0H67DRAFT_559076 [Lasiosphaeris hirsuta]
MQSAEPIPAAVLASLLASPLLAWATPHADEIRRPVGSVLGLLFQVSAPILALFIIPVTDPASPRYPNSVVYLAADETQN